jgi:hypothetical protein
MDIFSSLDIFTYFLDYPADSVMAPGNVLYTMSPPVLSVSETPESAIYVVVKPKKSCCSIQ